MIVADQTQRLVESGDDHVDIAVLIEVGEHRGAVDMRFELPRARLGYDGETRAAALHQQRALRVLRVHRRLGRLRINMAIDYEQILVGIEVEIKESRAPSDERATRCAQTELIGAVVEAAAVEVEMQGVGVAGEIGGEDIGAAIGVDVGDGDSHGCLLGAFAVDPDSRTQAIVAKLPRSSCDEQVVGL